MGTAARRLECVTGCSTIQRASRVRGRSAATNASAREPNPCGGIGTAARRLRVRDARTAALVGVTGTAARCLECATRAKVIPWHLRELSRTAARRLECATMEGASGRGTAARRLLRARHGPPGPTGTSTAVEAKRQRAAHESATRSWDQEASDVPNQNGSAPPSSARRPPPPHPEPGGQNGSAPPSRARRVEPVVVRLKQLRPKERQRAASSARPERLDRVAEASNRNGSAPPFECATPRASRASSRIVMERQRAAFECATVAPSRSVGTERQRDLSATRRWNGNAASGTRQRAALLQARDMGSIPPCVGTAARRLRVRDIQMPTTRQGTAARRLRVRDNPRSLALW